jgi:hypothetical protein
VIADDARPSRLPRLELLSELPAAGARVPGEAARAALIPAGTLLTLVAYGASGWLIAGAALSLGAALFPRHLLGWALILFLAASRVGAHSRLDWRLLVLMAGLHLPHVLAMLSLQLPVRSWAQPAVFIAPLRRFVAIQIPSQVIAILALLLLVDHNGHRGLDAAALTPLGAIAVAGLGVPLFGAHSNNHPPSR